MRARLAVWSIHRYALRDALRTAIVMPTVFAIGMLLFDDSQLALFAAFGAIAQLVFADFGGTTGVRLRAYLCLALAGLPLVALGTLCSNSPAAATVTMALVAFAILFCGVLDDRVAAGTPAAILAFVLAVMVPAPMHEVGSRLGGWALAGAAAITAVMLLWPRRPRDLLRARAADALRGLATCLEVGTDDARDDARAAVEALRRQFAATPYRPAGVAGPTAQLARMVTDLGWLTPLALAPPLDGERALDPAARDLRTAVQALLLACAPLLETRRHGEAALASRTAVEQARAALAERFEAELEAAAAAHDGPQAGRLIDAAFQLRVLSYSAWQLAGHALGACGVGPPEGEPEPEEERHLPGAVAAGREAAQRGLATAAEAGRVVAAHASMRSVWLQNSARGAVALAVAVLVGQLSDVQHAFWVVLGTLSVLRSHALDTGATVLRALAGTLLGIGVGALLVLAVGDRDGLLWAALPIAVLIAAYAPRAVSFAAGQAAFSLLVVVLFNLVEPTGWSVGLLRIEDVAIGCAVSLAVGALFWPRGAAAVLRAHLADAFASGADELSATVGEALGARSAAERERATAQALAAGRRLDIAFRQFLGERTSAHASFHDLALLVAGAVRLRRTASMLRSAHVLRRPVRDAEPGEAPGRDALGAEVEAVRTWMLAFADALRRGAPPPTPRAVGLAGQEEADARVAAWARDAVTDAQPLDLGRVLGIAWTSRHLALLEGTEPRLAGAAAGAFTPQT